MKTIGILGGGQLSQILSLKAKSLGIRVFVLSAEKEDPAAQKNPYWIKGDPNKIKDLKHFCQLVDGITFESEFFSAQQIHKILQNLKGKKPHVAPSLKALSLIQDRWTQKKLLLQNKINTAHFLKVSLENPSSKGTSHCESKSAQSAVLNRSVEKKLIPLWDQLGPFVLKSRTGGYDGYGTFIIKRKSQIKNIKLPSGSFIAEQFIPFKRELALLSARNKKARIIFFPLVESFQKNSICLWVKGPARHKRIDSLKKQIKNLLNEIDYQGVMAFELFDTGENLIVNELAPRVHNTGHYSLDALNEDQFTIHLKAIMNCPLAWPKTRGKGFAMLNLLGEGHGNPMLKAKRGIQILGGKERKTDTKRIKKAYFDLGKEPKQLVLKTKKEVHLWWYGKALSRKGRKMGHINAIDRSSSHALSQLLKIRPLFRI